MKTSKTLFAVIIIAILAITVVIVSCKKDDGKASNQKGYTIQQAADIRQMEDPRSYMIDFMKKLTESKDNEAFNLNDAAWHLACLANLDFCNVNVECDDFQFDTVEMQVNVTDGIILLGDLRTAYEQMCTEIQQFRKGFNHYDQNLYYINVSIGDDGNAKIALMTSFTNASKDDNHAWYFLDLDEAIGACYDYFSEDSIYTWNTTGARELTRIINIFESHKNTSNSMCYFPTRDHSFDYNNYDSYISTNWFYNNSRVFAIRDHYSGLDYDLSFLQLAYCVDSYLGLGCDYITNTYPNEVPVCWAVNPMERHVDHGNWYYHYHELHVDYGLPITPNPPTPDPK